jgi:hypothetical protein
VAKSSQTPPFISLSLYFGLVERSDIRLLLGQKWVSQEPQPPGWELRQRRERKESETQVKSNQIKTIFFPFPAQQ